MSKTKEVPTKEQLLELYKILEQKILENKEKFEEKKFKDDEIINILLETILIQERKTEIGILKHIDLEKINFDNQDIRFIDLSETNANIDPQKILNKNLQGTTLGGDFENKSFDDVYMHNTDCSKAKNISMHPQKIKAIINSNVDGVDFNNESFDGVKYEGTDFTNAKNCELTKSKFYQYKIKLLKINNPK